MPSNREAWGGYFLPRKAVVFLLSVIALLLLVVGFTKSIEVSDGQHEHFDDEALKLKARATANGDKYLIGVGKADITGPVVEIGLGGYADLDQTGEGLRQRLYSRAFIVADIDNPEDRFVYLVLDIQSGDTAMRYGILEGLAKLGSSYSVYGHNNLAVTGTHSHAGPGAWFNYLLPQITTFGFSKQSYQAIVDGAVLSIKRAHEGLVEVSWVFHLFN